MRKSKNLINLAWAISEKTITVSFSLVVTSILARYFGVELFGGFQFALGILFIATSMTWICPAEILYSKAKVDGSIDEDHIVTSIFYRLLVSAFVLILVMLYAFLQLKDENQIIFILILAASLIYSEPLGVFRQLLEMQDHYHLTSKIRITALFSKILLILLFTYLALPPSLIVIVIASESLIITLLTLYFANKKALNFSLNIRNFKFNVLKALFFEGIKLWPGLVFMTLFLKVDKLYLVSKLSSEKFGYYMAAFSMFEQVLALSTITLSVLAPTLIFKISENKLQSNVIKLTSIMILLGLVFATFMYFIAGDFILLIYGQKYIEAVSILQSLTLCIPLLFLDGSLNLFLIKKKLFFYCSLKWLLALAISFFIMYLTYEAYSWKSGVFGFYAGSITVATISIVYFLLMRNKYKYD